MKEGGVVQRRHSIFLLAPLSCVVTLVIDLDVVPRAMLPRACCYAVEARPTHCSAITPAPTSSTPRVTVQWSTERCYVGEVSGVPQALGSCGASLGGDHDVRTRDIAPQKATDCPRCYSKGSRLLGHVWRRGHHVIQITQTKTGAFAIPAPMPPLPLSVVPSGLRGDTVLRAASRFLRASTVY